MLGAQEKGPQQRAFSFTHAQRVKPPGRGRCGLKLPLPAGAPGLRGAKPAGL